jgi:uncharacterized repeat protein (TIGR01451 family)
MSALAAIIVLGLIAIAQAQRSGDPSPSPAAGSPSRGFSVPEANPLRSPSPIRTAAASNPVPTVGSRPGSPASAGRAPTQKSSGFSLGNATDTGIAPILTAPAEAPHVLPSAAAPTESIADTAAPAANSIPPISPNFGTMPPAAEQPPSAAPRTAAGQQPSANGPPIAAAPGLSTLPQFGGSTSEPGLIPQPAASPPPQPIQALADSPPGAQPTHLESSGLGQPATGNGRPGTKSLEGAQVPQLVVEKTAPAEIQVGRPAIFQIHVRNAGQVAALGVEIHDEIPRGARLQSAKPQASQSAQGGLVWEIGTLNPNEDVTVEIELMPTDEGEIGSVATVQFQTEASVRVKATRPLLAIETEGPEKVLKGEQVALKITVSNPGSGIAEDVVVEEHVPAGFRHAAGAELEYEIGNLAPGESRELELALEAVHAGPLVNVITVRGEPNLRTQNQKSIEVIAPQLQVAVEGPSRRYLEREAVYSLSVRNPGTAPARQVEMAVELPPGMKFVSGSNQAYYEEDTRTVHWKLEEIPVQDGPPPVQLTLMPVEAGQHTLRLVSFDSSGASAEVEQAVVVEGISALFFEVADMDDPIEVGGQTMYEIRVVNQGSKEATNVQLAAELPPGLQPVAAEGPTRHGIESGRVVFAPLPRLAPKADTTYRIRVQGVQPGDLRIKVQVVTDEIRTPITKEESTRVYADQ